MFSHFLKTNRPILPICFQHSPDTQPLSCPTEFIAPHPSPPHPVPIPLTAIPSPHPISSRTPSRTQYRPPGCSFRPRRPPSVPNTAPPLGSDGQGLLLCLGPCPHFGLPGTSNGQGPHHEIRPCPIGPLRAPHPATPSTARPRQRYGVNRKVLCVRRICKTAYVILHRRFCIND